MLNSLSTKKEIRSFSLSAENISGEKGMGARTPLEKGNAYKNAKRVGEGWKVNPWVVIPEKSRYTIADFQGQGEIKHLWLTDTAQNGRQLILRIWFDGQKNPAVEAPLSDFFAAANYMEYRQLTSAAICVNPRRGLNCYFPMPYFRSFRIELENRGDEPCNVFYQIDCEEKELPKDALYFHAQFRRSNPLPYKTPYVILDNIKGNGHYVGTYLYWGPKSNGWWGEGEIKFYIDGDTDYPTICGTGTEDYFCGAWCFDVDGSYVEYSTAFAGMYKIDSTDKAYRSQQYFNMYRWHLPDPIYFKKDLKVTIQALGYRSKKGYVPLMDDISSVAYWYSDSLEDEYPSLPQGDALDLY